MAVKILNVLKKMKTTDVWNILCGNPHINGKCIDGVQQEAKWRYSYILKNISGCCGILCVITEGNNSGHIS
jgi:hypothetical protein